MEMNQLFALLELERRRVNAVAQVRRLGAVFENMAEMSVAFAAHRFGAPHAVAVVVLGLDVLLHRRRPETRPAGARIELGFPAEQFIAATDAAINALLVIVPILARKRPLRAFLARDIELFVVQLLFPF